MSERQFTEDDIRAALDGTYTSAVFDDYGVKVITESVPECFIGEYAPAKSQSGLASLEWTTEDDDRLVSLRDQGKNWAEIGAIFGVSQTLVFHRYKALCKERSIQPKARFPKKSKVVPEAFQVAVAKLKDAGLSLTNISKKLNEKHSRVCWAWERERNRRAREAC
jgi:hypothetical protein